MRVPLQRLKRVLRAPRVIVLELVAIALAGVVSTAVSQSPSLTERTRLEEQQPVLAAVVRALGLDHVFRTWWFLALVFAAGASLAIVLVEQWRRLLREWGMRPTEASLGSAPLRAEFLRPARGGRSFVEVRRRVGLCGSPLFHAGLMVVVLAGLARMLFSAEAVVLLHEGEVLLPRPQAYGAQWRGPLAAPIALAVPIELQHLSARRYSSGRLEQLSARVGLGEGSPESAVLAVNTPLDIGQERLYLSGTHGSAAFVEVAWAGKVERLVLMLDEAEAREYVRREVLHDGLTLRLRASEGPEGERPGALEVRALRENALLAWGVLEPGSDLALPDGGRVILHDLRPWARFVAARDPSAWPAYLGFGTALLGAILMFTVVKVDRAIFVHPEGDQERVVVAMRPQRFAPLFREQFEELVRREGGSPPG